LLRKALAAQEQHVQSSNDEQKVMRSKLFIVTDGLGKIEENLIENLHVLAQQTTSEQARARAQEQKLQEEMEKLRGNEMQQLHTLKIYRHSGTNCKNAGATRRGCSRVAKTCRREPRNSCRGYTSWRNSAVMKKRSWFRLLYRVSLSND
jgi:hypothetical protein